MKNILKKEKGITLIALVTTIIILLILAGITIGTLSNNQGLINEANQSSQDAQKESIIEKIEAELYSEKTITGNNPSIEKTEEIIEKYGEIEDNLIKVPNKDNMKYSINFSEIEGLNEIFNKNEFYLDRFICDGSNYLNTGISLFSEENIRKDFEISFEVIHIGNIPSYETILNCILKKNNLDLGFNIYQRSGWYNISAASTSSNHRYNNFVYASILNENTNRREFVKYKINIKRVYNTLIYKIDDGNENEFIDYTDFSDTFDNPLTIGARLDENGNACEFFSGEITNIKVKLDDKSNYKETRTANSYKLDGEISFNGKNHINTGLKLFSSENINRNFEIGFDITKLESNKNSNTLVNSMDESGSPWPGFVVRYDGTDKFAFKANYSADTSGRKEDKISINNITKIKLKRENRKLYYSTNNSQFIELIDFTNINSTFDVPLTFGASLNGSQSAQRWFKGKLANISVKFTN